ncbi:Efflux pump radE [Paramyrothecium foliicola]|nr:Efflux pump radE [Paramyrothecium foliicola]
MADDARSLKGLEIQKDVAASDSSRLEDDTTVASQAGQDEEAGKSAVKEEINHNDDPNVVDWDGPDDPNKPINWPPRKKWANILTISVLSLLVPLGSSMFAPGVPVIMREFNTTDPTLATFVVSVYILGFAFGPLLAAPLSELYGRSICYHGSNLLFIVFTVGTALSNNMGTLVALRFFMGFAGSTPITIGSGTIADMFPVEERGKAMAIWAMGPLLGPCIGPVAGGFVVEHIGWRWVYWIIAIAAGVISVFCLLTLRETYPPTLLQAKVKRLRKSTGNGELYSAADDRTITNAQHITRAIVRPMKMLLTLPPIIILSLYVAVAYGILYILFCTFAFVFAQQYGFGSGVIGLSYLPTGIGMFFGIALFGGSSDRIIKAKQAKGEPVVPEDRLPHWMTIMSGLLVSVAMFWYGWSTEKHTHWIVPMIGVSILCFGLMGVMMCVQTYLVDSYPQYAASVIAAITVLRSLAGAMIPLGGLNMYDAMGLGWGNSLLGFIALALVPLPVCFRLFGAKLRARWPARL